MQLHPALFQLLTTQIKGQTAILSQAGIMKRASGPLVGTSFTGKRRFRSPSLYLHHARSLSYQQLSGCSTQRESEDWGKLPGHLLRLDRHIRWSPKLHVKSHDHCLRF